MDSIIKCINEKPVRFFKKLIPIFRDENFKSNFIPKLYRSSEYEWAEKFEKDFDNNPSKGSQVANIFRILQKHYEFTDFDYQDKDYYQIALYIHRNYHKRIDKYMDKKLKSGELGAVDKPWHTDITGFREQVARGFIIAKNYKIEHKDSFYIKSTLSEDLIYPQLFNNFEDTYSKRVMVGVEGYTGINQPKHK